MAKSLKNKSDRPGYEKDGLPNRTPILSLPSDEAADVIRRSATRRAMEKEAKVADVARRRTRDATREVTKDVPPEAWGRAFEAVILFYERVDDVEMADLLRLDLDRYVRRGDVVAQVEWAKQKEKAG